MTISEKNGIFIIETENTQYVMGVDSDGLLRHIYWGKKCSPDSFLSAKRSIEKNSNYTALDYIKQEYTPFGSACYRVPALFVRYADGCRECVQKYASHKISETENGRLLEIELKDEPYSLSVTLCYSIKEGFDVIGRSVKIKNDSSEPIVIEKASSGEFNFPSKRAYTSTNANGAWASEFKMEQTEVKNGTLVYETRKGTSEHTYSPAFILTQNADETQGEVFYGALAWTGSYKVEINRDHTNCTRAVIGINDFDFSFTLHPSEEFITPSVFCGYARSLDEMSNQMNRFSVEHILPKRFAKEPLPVLYNSWEATEFNVSSDSQQRLAELASKIGCELFVMDDGWFGQRKDDHAGLGDWYVNEEKFPQGLSPLIDRVKSLGMKFGLWFEPEMVNPDSDLYREHPDWTYHFDTRTPSLLRNQLVLNLTKPQVQEFVFDCMDKLLSVYDIDYIKWDANRPISEAGAQNLENAQELRYRHIRAVYEIADRLKAKYPDLQIEACASGGGRAELGAMSHFDMVWTSDNTDPVDRLTIQHGYSLLYPIKCMRAWVTDTNRHSRPYDWDFRFNVSMQGSLSIGGNLLKYTDEELEIHRKYIEMYKSIRSTVQFGSFHRLASYSPDGFYATQYTDNDRTVVFICGSVNTFFSQRGHHIKLRGLDSNKKYTAVSGMEKSVFSGDALMNVGLDFELGSTLDSKIIIFE